MAASPNKPKSRLGRGLNSLIRVSTPPPPAADVSAHPPGSPGQASVLPPPAEIPLDSIRPNPHQPRTQIDAAFLTELAASMKSTGLIQPIIVRPTEQGYELIAGERRWRAAQMAGLTSIPAVIRSVDNTQQAEMALIENIQREDLNPIDRASAYKRLMDEHRMTQDELADRTGEQRSSVANYLRLLELAGPVRDLVRQRRLSVGHAKLLASVHDLLEQQRLADLVLRQELSVRNLERLIADGGAPRPSRSAGVRSVHLADLEKTIARQLGMRVQVRSRGKGGKGRVVIHYSSLDQFDELMSRLGVRVDAE